MTNTDFNVLLSAIIDQLNALAADAEDSGDYGVADVGLALDLRADAWRDDHDGESPPPTEAEMAAIIAECEGNRVKFERIESAQSRLKEAYFSLADCYPHLNSLNRYERNWKDELGL